MDKLREEEAMEEVVEEEEEENEETTQADFTLIEKEIKGKAYLIGNQKKATLDFIKAFVNSPAVPANKKDKIEAELESKLIIEFSAKAKIKKPDTDADAIMMLGETTAMNMIKTKVETNQMDKVRNKLSDEIVKKSNMASIMADIFKA